jgi:hypothetical protein
MVAIPAITAMIIMRFAIMDKWLDFGVGTRHHGGEGGVRWLWVTSG